MMTERIRLMVFMGGSFAAVALLLLIIQRIEAREVAAAELNEVGSTALVIGRQVVLYNPALNTGTLADQGFTYSDLLGPNAVSSFNSTEGVTLLDTTAAQSDLAGFGSVEAVTLDPSSGYTVRFAAQVVSESHSNENRAGFSVIALGSGMRGLEIGFWEDEVWVQEGGSASTLFTHAEGAAYDTTGSQADGDIGPLTQYQLSVITDTYALSAAPLPRTSVQIRETQLLSGTVRDYTAFSGFPDVYETANFLFFGDDTSSAQAEANISMISAIVAEAPASRVVTAGSSINVDDLGIIVQSSDRFTVSFAADAGIVDLDTTIPGGVTDDDMVSALSATVFTTTGTIVTGSSATLFADANAINTTLAHPGGLVYQSPLTASGMDTLTVTVDNGSQEAQQVIQITINSSPPLETATPSETATSAPPMTSTPIATSSPATPTPQPGSAQMPPSSNLYLPVVVP